MKFKMMNITTAMSRWPKVATGEVRMAMIVLTAVTTTTDMTYTMVIDGLDTFTPPLALATSEGGVQSSQVVCCDSWWGWVLAW